MLLFVLAIIGWLLGDKFASAAAQARQETARLSVEYGKLQALVEDAGLTARVAAAQSRALDLRTAAYSGASLISARAQLAADLQRLLAKHSANGALFRLTRAVGTPPSRGSNSTPTTPTAPSDALPLGFIVESFSVTGTFTPGSLLGLLSDFAASPRLIAIDGLSIKGSRFELLGVAVLTAASQTTQSP